MLDELQWTAEASPELPSILHALWETEWAKRKDILVILCGSHVGFMEREILVEKSPLFGPRGGQIKLGPLPYPEAALMLPHYSATDRAGVYFLVGGVPAYLEQFVPGRLLHEAIAEEFCSELRFFALEPHSRSHPVAISEGVNGIDMHRITWPQMADFIRNAAQDILETDELRQNETDGWTMHEEIVPYCAGERLLGQIRARRCALAWE